MGFDSILSVLINSKTLIIAGAVLSTAGAIRASFEDAKEQKEFASELREKNNEILRLTNLNSAAITGGDSYPEVIPSIDDDGKRFRIVVSNNGRFPVYDLTMIISDIILQRSLYYKDSNGKLAITQEALDKSQQVERIGNLAADTVLMMDYLPLRGSSDHYHFQFSARNGTFSQSLKFKRVNGKWVVATKVSSIMPDNKVLKEVVPDNFPKDESK